MYAAIFSSNLWFQFAKEITGEEEAIMDIIRDSLPRVSVYFMTVVMFYAGVSVPMYLLRPWDILTFIIPHKKPPPVPWYPAQEVTNPGMVIIYGFLYVWIA